MSQSEGSDQSSAPSRKKLSLPEGACPDVDLDDLICADIVNTNDGAGQHVLLFARPNRVFIVDATPGNIAALRAVVTVNQTSALKKKVASSADLVRKLDAKKGMANNPLKDASAEIVYLGQEKVVSVMLDDDVFYFEYDAIAKEALEKGGIAIGVKFGGTSALGNLAPQ